LVGLAFGGGGFMLAFPIFILAGALMLALRGAMFAGAVLAGLFMLALAFSFDVVLQPVINIPRHAAASNAGNLDLLMDPPLLVDDLRTPTNAMPDQFRRGHWPVAEPKK
jgi:hypothetical protein